MLVGLYERMLKLYPESYQRRYAHAMLQTLQDILADDPSPIRRAWTVFKEIAVTPLNALEQYLIVFAQNRHVTPKTTVSLLGLALLLPFFVALIADEVAEFLIGSHLYGTWLWSKPVLLTWIVILPLMSLAVSISVYAISTIRMWKRERKLAPFAKRHWLTLMTMLFSLGILFIVVFHDSVHCWTVPRPIAIVVNCTEAGILGGDQH